MGVLMRNYNYTLKITTANSISIFLYALLFYDKISSRMPNLSYEYIIILYIVYTISINVIYNKIIYLNVMLKMFIVLFTSIVSGSIAYIITSLFFHGTIFLSLVIISSTFFPFFLLYSWVPGLFSILLLYIYNIFHVYHWNHK